MCAILTVGGAQGHCRPPTACEAKLQQGADALIQATKKAYLKRYTKKNDKKGHLNTERMIVFFKTTIHTSRAGMNIKLKMMSNEQSEGIKLHSGVWTDFGQLT